ncbi:MAG: hypothetical protein ACYC9P_09300 [Rudaea sp.]
MKIQQNGEQLIIDNSLVSTIILAATLGIVGLGLAIYGVDKHLLVAMGIGAAFILGCVLFMAFSRSSHIVLSKNGSSTASSKTLFGSSKSETFSLADVNSVLLSTSELHGNVKDPDGTIREQTKVNANIYLLTKTAQRIHLGGTSQMVSTGGLIGAIIESLPLRAEAIRIAAFIGVQLQSSDAVGTSQFVS